MKLSEFCLRTNTPFPPVSTGQIAEFMCELADNSERPQSVLKSALAAISCLYKVKAADDISQRREVHDMKDALIKCATTRPMERSKVMPVKPFYKLFKSWPKNEDLSIKHLRLKVITLMALTLMLRPSDIAPKGTHVIGTDKTKYVFSTDNIKQLADGGLMVTFFGTKNDTSRSGFEVHLPPSSDAEIDPCTALLCYIARTDDIRPLADKPVFLTLRKPFKAIDASTASDIMAESISLAGLGGQGYGPKCFRPTGATVAVETKHDPADIMKTGRWKTASVFFEHYVHAKNKETYTDSLLGHD